ncbi:MAG: hypothetical protein GY953_46610 [bacterium]|nr:hypothetical protein [bacterium]
MPAQSGTQYTIRGIPPEVDSALRKKAHQKRISLNRLLVEELAQAAGLPSKRKRRSLDGIAGRWKEDPEFDRAVEDQRKIDWDLWR